MGATARGLLNQIQNFEFIFLMQALYSLFKETNFLSECLQQDTIDIVHAHDLAEATVTKLNKLTSDDEFKLLLEDSFKLANENNITSPIISTSVLTRNAKRFI